MTIKELKERFGIDKPVSAIPYWHHMKEYQPASMLYDNSLRIKTQYNEYVKWLEQPLTEQILKEVFGFDAHNYYKQSGGFKIGEPIEAICHIGRNEFEAIDSEGAHPKVLTINDLLSAAEKENIQLELNK